MLWLLGGHLVYQHLLCVSQARWPRPESCREGTAAARRTLPPPTSCTFSPTSTSLSPSLPRWPSLSSPLPSYASCGAARTTTPSPKVTAANALCPPAGTLAPPFGGEPRERQEFPGVPEWLDLNIIVPVSATVVVVCVGILVVCVALSRRKQPPMMNPGCLDRF